MNINSSIYFPKIEYKDYQKSTNPEQNLLNNNGTDIFIKSTPTISTNQSPKTQAISFGLWWNRKPAELVPVDKLKTIFSNVTDEMIEILKRNGFNKIPRKGKYDIVGKNLPNEIPKMSITTLVDRKNNLSEIIIHSKSIQKDSISKQMSYKINLEKHIKLNGPEYIEKFSIIDSFYKNKLSCKKHIKNGILKSVYTHKMNDSRWFWWRIRRTSKELPIPNLNSAYEKTCNMITEILEKF